jgi:hypothetical protein
MHNVGSLYVWENNNKQQIVIICTEDDRGVVVHSDGLMKLGTYMTIDETFKSFIGTVNLVSKESNNET